MSESSTRDERGVRLRHVAGHGQQQRHGLFGGREDVRLRGVDHHDTTLGGCRGVDVVEADASTADNDEIGSSGEHLGRDIGGRADDERMRAHDGLHELLGAQALLHIDGVSGCPETVEAAVRDGFSDEDPCHKSTILPAHHLPRQTTPCDFGDGASTSETDDVDRFEIVGEVEAEDPAVEVRLGLECPSDRLGPPEPVTLTLEGEIRVRDTGSSECVDHQLRLVGRHHRIVETLQHEERAAEQFGVVDRRTGLVEIPALGPRPDE